jgi:hypothetical protein
VQRPRDGRGGERQHVDRLPQSLEPLLVLDAETLLLVDDDQPQILELHVGADEPVRADDDVDAALRQPAQDGPLLAGRAEAAQALDGKRVLGQALRKRAEMLLSEHGRRHQHGDLPAVVDRLERRPHRQLGLAVADVAAD